MKLKHKLFLKVSSIIQSTNIFRFYVLKDDQRENTTFKLVFFCGEKSLSYLNASLISVYKNWGKLPDIIVISDGSPTQKIKKGLIKWPRKVKIISWQECAEAFKDNGNSHLHSYATNELIGRKLVGIMYCAETFPILYSDSDILWYKLPEFNEDMTANPPYIKMSQDIGHYYTKEILEALEETQCLNNTPYNSGVVYVNGQFNSFPKWEKLLNYLGTHKELGWFSEQTTFAILNNHFSSNYFNLAEVLIKVNDQFSLENTRKQYPNIVARHYVNIKSPAFWRDFLFMLFKKNHSS